MYDAQWCIAKNKAGICYTNKVPYDREAKDVEGEGSGCPPAQLNTGSGECCSIPAGFGTVVPQTENRFQFVLRFCHFVSNENYLNLCNHVYPAYL